MNWFCSIALLSLLFISLLLIQRRLKLRDRVGLAYSIPLLWCGAVRVGVEPSGLVWGYQDKCEAVRVGVGPSGLMYVGPSGWCGAVRVAMGPSG